MEWIKSRVVEPSSWAAVGGVLIGFGLLFSQPALIVVGIVVGIGGFVLKEKNII